MKSVGTGTANDASVGTTTEPIERPDDHADEVRRLTIKVDKAEKELAAAKAALAAAEKEG